jgi:hypothetical protein
VAGTQKKRGMSTLLEGERGAHVRVVVMKVNFASLVEERRPTATTVELGVGSEERKKLAQSVPPADGLTCEVRCVREERSATARTVVGALGLVVVVSARRTHHQCPPAT